MSKESNKIDILIPSIKLPDELRPMVQAIGETARLPHRIIMSNEQVSAAVNRNICLTWCRSPLAIMLDDDIEGFWPGWDEVLVCPLRDDESVVAVSARLMNSDGSVGPSCADEYRMEPRLIEILPAANCVMPTAAIAFRNLGCDKPLHLRPIQFDESYVGSGFEDGDFFFQYLDLRRGYKFLINNDCKLVHRNEMKKQHEHGNFQRNWSYFDRKWGDRCDEFNVRPRRRHAIG